jgi:hypothetical protein
MKIVILVILVLAVAAGLGVVLLRGGRRTYQKYSGLERQRNAAKQSRETGADRIKTAERHLIEAQQELVGRKDFDKAKEIERLRTQLSTLADRLRHSTYGYSPVGSPNPIHEAELADLQDRDAAIISEADGINNLAEQVKTETENGEVPDLRTLKAALENLRTTLDRRRTVN